MAKKIDTAKGDVGMVVGTVTPSRKKPLLFIVAIVAVVVVAIVSYVVFGKSGSKKPQATNTTASSPVSENKVVLPPVTPQEVAKHRDTISATGTFQSVSGKNLVISINKRSTTFTTTDKTTVFEGDAHTKKQLSDIKAGTQVTVSYSNATKEVTDVWFE